MTGREEIKKCIFSYIQNQWSDTEIFFQRSRKDASSDSWLCVYLQEATKAATRKSVEIVVYNVNLSLFATDDNAYFLEVLEDKLAALLEGRTLFSDRYQIQFEEFDSIDIEEQGLELEKTISHKSINCTVRAWRKQ